MSKKGKTIGDLTLADDFLFAKVMSDCTICRKVLEKILKIPIKKVVVPTTQKTINVLFEGKGIRLDVYVNDDKGTVYNVEMQRGKKKELKKTYIIFICTFDPFNDKRHIYTFENRCQENSSLVLGDEVIRIFLNTKGKMDDVTPDMKEFLAYVENTTDAFAQQVSDPLIKEIHKRVMEVKQNKEMEVEYMTLYMRDRENLEQGREEGTLLATKILKLHTRGVSSEEIAATLDLSLDYVQGTITQFEND